MPVHQVPINLLPKYVDEVTFAVFAEACVDRDPQATGSLPADLPSPPTYFGGLVISQFITLFITPVIYLYLERFQENVLDRTSFFGSRKARRFAGGSLGEEDRSDRGLGDRGVGDLSREGDPVPASSLEVTQSGD